MGPRSFAFVISALVLVAVGWWFFARGTAVEVVTAERGDAAQAVYATGIVEPVHWAKVTALQRKRIVDLCSCEGETVKKGEVLARLDDAEERARLRELEARLDRLRADVRRIAKLVERNVAARVSLDEKLTAVLEFEARVEAQKERIADLELKSPVDGIVLRRDGEVGEIAGTGPDDVLLWVGRSKPLRVVSEVNEEDIGRVQKGQKVLLRHDGFENSMLEATVGSLTPKGDPETKTFRVYLALPDDTPLMIGMSVEANIIVYEVRGAVLVPTDAIDDGKVIAVKDGKAARVAVRTGIKGARKTEIREGLGEGDLVLSPYRQDIKDGARVRYLPFAGS